MNDFYELLYVWDLLWWITLVVSILMFCMIYDTNMYFHNMIYNQYMSIWLDDMMHDMKQCENCMMSWYSRLILVVEVKDCAHYYGPCHPMKMQNDVDVWHDKYNLQAWYDTYDDDDMLQEWHESYVIHLWDLLYQLV